MKITVRLLLTAPHPSGLGYCCPWLFFRHFKQTGLIALRLGVTDRAVRYAKAEARCASCEGKANCMKREVAKALRSLPLA